MSINKISKEKQAFGAFDNGAIIENKPIGFPQDRGQVKPYSNLFYWANAWSDKGGLIDEHPHKWFEILSFVLEGEIEHYDNKFNRWLKLQKGDAQIIRSGNGITHAEKILPNSRMFQIWFNPNIKKTQTQPASYNDYKASEFNCKINNTLKITSYAGNGSAVKMDSEGVSIYKIELPKGSHQISLNENFYTSIYSLKSDGLLMNQTKVNQDDFIIIENEQLLEIHTESIAELFVIETPIKLSYVTYTEMAKF